MSAIVQLGEEDLALELSRLSEQILFPNSGNASNAPSSSASSSASSSVSAEGVERKIGPFEQLALALKYEELFESAIFSSYEKIHLALLATPNVDWEKLDLFFCLTLAVLERVSPLQKLVDSSRKLLKLIHSSNSNASLTPVQHWAALYVIRMRFAVNLFNALYGKARDVESSAHSSDVSSRLYFDVLGTALEALALVLRMALDSHNAALLAKQLKQLPVWLAAYSTEAAKKLGVKPPADLYLQAYQICKETTTSTNGLAVEADGYLLSYLRAMNGAKTEEIEKAIPYAQEAALRAISAPLDSHHITSSKSSSSASSLSSASAASSSLPSSSQLLPARPLDAQRLLSLDVVKALSSSSSSSHQLTWRLLSIFSLAKPVPSYLDFAVQQGREFLKTHSLDHAALLRKLRTLTLCRLALESERLAYADVALHLGIPSGAAAAAEQMDVIEGAVIDAIQSGRLEARLDEETDSVLVKRVTGVQFAFVGEEGGEWKQLANKLATWKSNVTQVVTTLSLSPQQQSFEADGSEDI